MVPMLLISIFIYVQLNAIVVHAAPPSEHNELRIECLDGVFAEIYRLNTAETNEVTR